jgi:hypothetical protein
MTRPVEFTQQQWEAHQRLVGDYEFFSRHIQMIEPKDIVFEEDDEAKFEALWREDSTQGMVPLVFRPGQLKLHKFVEEMKTRRGMVAAALVKPRQVGWSTYIQGRIHWLSTKTPGLKSLIVSHNKDSTGKFLRRIRKMCASAPTLVTPGRPLDNAKEIGFANGAYIGIATAGSKDAIRSDNAQILHGSEETSWENEMELGASIFPALSFARGSEAYRETTSKGKNTPWHKFILESLAGENRWEVFFDAYFNDPRYRLTPPPGWEPDDEARHHAHQFLTHMMPEEQAARLYWRAMMIKDLRAHWLFKQEYPAEIHESFQSSEDTLYPPDAVSRARENGKHGRIPLDAYAPLIMGVDPARTGDRTVIAFRQGKVVRECITWRKMDDMRLVGIIAKFLGEGYNGVRPAKCFIDYAIGEGCVSRLRELGFFREVQSVHFGESPMQERYANKRAEMYMELRDWIGDTGEHVSIPDSDDIVADLLAIPDFVVSTGSEKIKLRPKDEIKKLCGRSPDIADALVLTFAYPVRAERVAELHQFAKENLAHAKPTELASIMLDFER